MRSNRFPEKNDTVLLTHFPKDIWHLILEYLWRHHKNSLSLSSKTLYYIVQDYQLSQLYRLSHDQQLSELVKLTLHINDAENNKQSLIRAIRRFSRVSYPNPLIAALALTCLAKLTTLSPTERAQRIYALEKIPPIIAKSLSSILVPKFNELSLSIHIKPCTLDELANLSKTEILLCFCLLGLSVDIEYRGSLQEKFHNIVSKNPAWLVPMLITPLIQSKVFYFSLQLKPRILSSTETLSALPLVTEELVSNADSKIETVFCNLINNIDSSEANAAWQIIKAPILAIHDNTRRRRIITKSLNLFKHSKEMALELHPLILNEVSCSDLSPWVNILISHVPHENLSHIIIELTSLFMKKPNCHELWSDLIAGVHTAELAVEILLTISRELSLKTMSGYPHENIHHKLFKLLNENLKEIVLQSFISRLSCGQNIWKIRELICDLVKTTNQTTAQNIIDQLIDSVDIRILSDKRSIADIVLRLTPMIDTEGKQIMLPLLLKLIKPEHDLAYPQTQKEKQIAAFILNNSILTDGNNIPLIKSYDDLNLLQISNIWAYLIAHFGTEIAEVSIYCSLMIKIACRFPNNSLKHVDNFLLYAIANKEYHYTYILYILENIRKSNSLCKIVVANLFECIFTSYPIHTNKFLHELPLFIRLYQCKSFNSRILQIIFLHLANGDKRIYDRLCNNEETPLFRKLVKTKRLKGDYYFAQELLSVLLTLAQSEHLIMINSLQEILMRYDHSAFIARLKCIKRISPKEISKIHSQLLSKIPSLVIHEGKLVEACLLFFTNLNESQQSELFDAIYSLRTLNFTHYRLLAIILSVSNEATYRKFQMKIAERRDLWVALGHYLPPKLLTESLHPPISFEDFYTNYLELSGLPQSNDITSFVDSMIACIKMFNANQQINNATKREYVLTFINCIRNNYEDRWNIELIKDLILMQITVEYHSPELAFLFPEPQHENVWIRFNALLTSLSRQISNRHPAGLAQLNHPLAALLLINSLPLNDDIAHCKQQAYKSIKTYCQHVTQVVRLDELTKGLLDARSHVLSHIFRRSATVSIRSRMLYAHRLREFGLFQNERCSLSVVEIFKMIEQRKEELQAMSLPTNFTRL